MKKFKKKQKKEAKKEATKKPFLLLSILIVGFLLRLYILNEIKVKDWASTQLIAGTDMITYHSTAEEILKGRHPVFASGTTAIYPYLLAAIYL
ncbi:hypothetical protein KKH65_00720, partial [bacterium]|nr:hypothetical protein [bacterium]